MEIAAVSHETRSHFVSLAFSIHLPGRTNAVSALIETKADTHAWSLWALVYRVDETHHDRRVCRPGQISAAHRYVQPLLSRGAPIAGRTRRGLGNTGASRCRIVPLRRWPDIGDRRRIVSFVKRWQSIARPNFLLAECPAGNIVGVSLGKRFT